MRFWSNKMFAFFIYCRLYAPWAKCVSIKLRLQPWPWVSLHTNSKRKESFLFVKNKRDSSDDQKVSTLNWKITEFFPFFTWRIRVSKLSVNSSKWLQKFLICTWHEIFFYINCLFIFLCFATCILNLDSLTPIYINCP